MPKVYWTHNHFLKPRLCSLFIHFRIILLSLSDLICKCDAITSNIDSFESGMYFFQFENICGHQNDLIKINVSKAIQYAHYFVKLFIE